MTILEQLREGDEYRYRDKATGRVLTAIEARQVKGPCRVEYLPPDSPRLPGGRR